MSGFDLSGEAFEKDYAKVADGVYSTSEHHFVNGMPYMGPINNRAFIYEVTNSEGTKHLLQSGIPSSESIPKVKKLEQDTGLKLTLIVGSGDQHHMALKSWLEEFPDVKIIQSGLKFPTTANGKEILANEEWKSRITLHVDETFPMLEQYSDIVQFFGFNKALIYPEAPFMTTDLKKPAKVSKLDFMKNFGKMKATQPFLAVWHYHVPSKQLVYEHNFDLYLTKAVVKSFPFPMTMMMKSCNCASALKGPIPKAPSTVEDCKTHCELMQKILQLDVRAMTDYHANPTYQALTFDSKEDFLDKFTKVLKKTGEHDPTGAAMNKACNGGGCTIM